MLCVCLSGQVVYVCYACRCEQLCVQVCMHVGVSICCVHVYACRGQCCVYIGTHVRSSASCVCVYMHKALHISIYIYISVHACLYVCMYVYAHFILSYTYTQPQVPSKKAHKYTM